MNASCIRHDDRVERRNHCIPITSDGTRLAQF